MAKDFSKMTIDTFEDDDLEELEKYNRYQWLR